MIIGGILSLGVVGAFQLRNDEGLTETNFMALMFETYKRLPFLKQDKSESTDKKNSGKKLSEASLPDLVMEIPNRLLNKDEPESPPHKNPDHSDFEK